MYLVLLMLFAFINLQGSVSANCQGGWTYYKEDEVCLREFEERLGWQGARANCKENGGDLVQIHTKHKQNAAKALRSRKDFRYWIGLSDLENDGTFDYLNGTKLVEGTLDISKDWTPVSPSGEKRCVVFDFYDLGLSLDPCNHTRFHLCEIRLTPGPTTVVGSDPCKRSSWTKVDQKFLYFHRQLGNFSTASEHCSAFGGLLLRQSSAEEVHNITETNSLWKPGAMFFWIGLKQLEGDLWAWDRGDRLVEEEYENWDTRITATPSGLCAAVVWAVSPFWNKVACTSLNFHICEATAPCGTTVFMAVDGVKQMKNFSTFDHQDIEDVMIECFQEGTGPDTHISIECTPGPEKEDGSRRVNMFLPKKYQKSGASCTCKFVYEDETDETFGIKFKPMKIQSHAEDGKLVYLFLLVILVLLLISMPIIVGCRKKEDEVEENNDSKAEGDASTQSVDGPISPESANDENETDVAEIAKEEEGDQQENGQ